MNTAAKKYDVIELQKMDKRHVEAIASEMGIAISMEDNSKQTLIYAILDKQAQEGVEK